MVRLPSRFDWITANVYQPMLDRGYNHLQVNWLLSLCCFGQYYLDGPEPSSQDLAIYEEGRASSTMRLDVWQNDGTTPRLAQRSQRRRPHVLGF